MNTATTNRQVLKEIGDILNPDQKIELLDSLIGMGEGVDDRYLLELDTTEAIDTIFGQALRDLLSVLCIDFEHDRWMVHDHCAEAYASQVKWGRGDLGSSANEDIVDRMRQIDALAIIGDWHFSPEEIDGLLRDLKSDYPLLSEGRECSKCGKVLRGQPTVSLTVNDAELARANPGTLVRIADGQLVAESKVPELNAQAKELGEGFEVFCELQQILEDSGPAIYLGAIFLGWSQEERAEDGADRMSAVTDAEIIEFFAENFGLPEAEQSIDGCWHALICEIAPPLEDPDILMGGFRDDLADTERAHCDHTCDCAYFKKVQHAAQLFGLTAEQIADDDYELAPRFADQLE